MNPLAWPVYNPNMRIILLLSAALALAGQSTLPPLAIPPYGLPRPTEVVGATYLFAADHPDVLKYMPCYCGCEQSGHRSNEDCFVKSRSTDGKVTEWEDHGMVCAMCLAVCETAMRMHADGASLGAIRTEIERTLAPLSTTRTPTPAPPK